LFICTTISFTASIFADKPYSFKNIANKSAFQFPEEIGKDLLNREQQLIFGLVVLNRRYPTLRNDGYSYYLRELLKTTGYSADEAKKIIADYNDNPKKWLVALENIRNTLIAVESKTNE
jgi:hypothetical protein